MLLGILPNIHPKNFDLFPARCRRSHLKFFPSSSLASCKGDADSCCTAHFTSNPEINKRKRTLATASLYNREIDCQFRLFLYAPREVGHSQSELGRLTYLLVQDLYCRMKHWQSCSCDIICRHIIHICIYLIQLFFKLIV